MNVLTQNILPIVTIVISCAFTYASACTNPTGSQLNESARILHAVTSNGSAPVGGEATVMCNDNYVFVSDHTALTKNITCQANNEWNEITNCIPTCAPPTSTDHVSKNVSCATTASQLQADCTAAAATAGILTKFYNNSCYVYKATTMTHTQAEGECHTGFGGVLQAGHLAVFPNIADLIEVNTILPPAGIWIWIGGYQTSTVDEPFGNYFWKAPAATGEVWGPVDIPWIAGQGQSNQRVLLLYGNTSQIGDGYPSWNGGHMKALPNNRCVLGGVAQYTCHFPYSVDPGTDTDRICTAFDTWSDTEPLCHKTCAPLPNLQVDIKSVTYSNPSRVGDSRYIVGTYANVTCAPTYMLEHARDRTELLNCTDQDTWDAQPQNCVIAPPTIVHDTSNMKRGIHFKRKCFGEKPLFNSTDVAVAIDIKDSLACGTLCGANDDWCLSFSYSHVTKECALARVAYADLQIELNSTFEIWDLMGNNPDQHFEL